MTTVELVSKFVGIDELDELVYVFQREISLIISQEIIGDFEVLSFSAHNQDNSCESIDKIIVNDISDYGYCSLRVYCIFKSQLIGIGTYSYVGDEFDPLINKVLESMAEVFSIFLYKLLEKSEGELINEGISIKASVSDLVSIVAHEVKTPLQYLLAKIQILKYKFDNEELKADVDVLEKEVNRVSHLVEELLEISKFSINDGKIVVYDSRAVIDEMIELMDKKLSDEKIMLTYNKAKDPILVTASPVILKQILINLINNAVFALRGNEQKEISLSVASNYDSCVISVKDNGCGICEDDLPYVFKKGFTTKKEFGGTGLGLYTVKIFMKAIGGAIDVYSDENHGTSFIIKIPHH